MLRGNRFAAPTWSATIFLSCGCLCSGICGPILQHNSCNTMPSGTVHDLIWAIVCLGFPLARRIRRQFIPGTYLIAICGYVLSRRSAQWRMNVSYQVSHKGCCLCRVNKARALSCPQRHQVCPLLKRSGICYCTDQCVLCWIWQGSAYGGCRLRHNTVFDGSCHSSGQGGGEPRALRRD